MASHHENKEEFERLGVELLDFSAAREALRVTEEARKAVQSLPCIFHQDRTWAVTLVGYGRLCNDCYRERAFGMLTLVNRAVNEPADLLLWSMGDLQPQLREGAPKDNIVYYFNGAGTSNYANPPSIKDVEAQFKLGKHKNLTIAGFSAGGRAVQKQLERAFKSGDSEEMPNAICMADALYAPQDAAGNPVMSTLQSVVDFAIRAAKGECIAVLWHSNIPTPGYASSKKCVEAVEKAVADAMGSPFAGLDFNTPELVSLASARPFVEAKRYGLLYIFEYKGQDKAEHVAEAHLIDDFLKAFIPWHRAEPSIGDFVYFPEATTLASPPVYNAPPGEKLLSEVTLEVAKTYLLAGVQETTHNAGSVVDAMLKAVGAGSPNNWCAAFVAQCIRDAQLLCGKKAPIVGSAGAKDTMARFQKANKWLSAAFFRSNAYKILPGMIPVWHRGAPGAWTGHIGVAEQSYVDGTFSTIEGNSGPTSSAVARMVRNINDPNFLGCGILDG